MKRFHFFARKARLEKDLDAELRFHLDSVIQEKIAAGFSPGEARRRALLEFGGTEQIKEECRDTHRLALVENILMQGKSALRFLRKSPGFSMAVIITLALGVGANSAVFSALDAILLRPLAYYQASQLVVLHEYNRSDKNPVRPIAPIRLEEWNRYNSTLQSLAGSYTQDLSETSGELPERLTEAEVTPRFLRVLGVMPKLGRDFTSAEEHWGGPKAVLISDRLWKRRFQADPKVIGKILRIESVSVPIIGVLPASLTYPDRQVDLWRPVPMDAPIAQSRAATWFTGIGRLKPGITPAGCRADLDRVQARLAQQFPQTDRDLTIAIEPLHETIVAGVRRSLWILFGSVTLLLLIACTNIAALLLSRTTKRAQEIALRYSLGASRGSILTQLMAEVFLLALAGSVLGLVLATGCIRLFHSFTESLPRAEDITLDGRLVAYTLSCAVVTTLLCGLLPALLASRRSLSSTLALHTRTQVSARASSWQGILVGAQVGFAVILLVHAGLLLRSFQELGRVSSGFDPEGVLTFRISGNYSETGDQKNMLETRKRMLENVAAVPGVTAAAISAMVPGTTRGFPLEIKIADDETHPDRKITADEKVVYGAYFEALRIPLLAGNTCPTNTLWTTAVVNRSFAETYFNKQAALGHHLAISAYAVKPEIIGIVADARENGLQRPPLPTVYWCSSNATPSPYFLLRTQGDPMSLAGALTRKLHQIEPRRSVFEMMPLTQRLSESNAESRMRTILLTFFALTALFLAVIGLYGTLSYLVALRRREIGVRLALGALPSQIRASFLKQGTSIALLGCLAGLAIAAMLSRLLETMLYGISRLDPQTYVAVAVGVLVLAAISSVLPALRASRLDPMITLRHE